MIGQLLTGRYLILEKLGAGGFSETYLARDKYLPYHPLCVVKRLKLPPSDTISLETAQRLFETEACVLEQLGRQHAQIPTLFAYSHAQDPIYLVEEYIEGINLGEWLASEERLPSKAAIGLLFDLLPVLDYLHSHRVIHRDITPSNLIRRPDGKVVLIDFGAACFLQENEASTKPDNDAPITIGTPGYMPNEQYLGMAQLNSDLYALGIVVIHLLTGADPRQFKPDLISGELDWQRYLGEHAVEPEFIAILNRMVREQVADRYQRAIDVLTDLQTLPAAKQFQRWSSIYTWKSIKWGKAIQKRAIPITAAVMLVGVGGWFAQAHSEHLGSLLSQVGKAFPRSNVHLTMLHDTPASDVERMIIAPNNRLLVTAGSDHSLQLWSLPDGALLKSLPGQQGSVKALAISQDSNFLVSGGEDGSVRLWDTAGTFRRAFQGHTKPVTTIAISPDSRTLVSGSQDGTLRQWDIQTGKLLQTLKLPAGEVTALTYGTTSNQIISASSTESTRQLQVWDLRAGELSRTFTGHTDAIVSLQVVDDHLYSFGKDRGLVWDLKREELVQVLSEESAHSITASLCDRHIMSIHDDGKIRVWIPKAGRLAMKQAGALERNANAVLSPNHQYLVSWSTDRHLRVWQIQDSSVY
ncbi:serine/threonine protein kinase [Leptolyngbya sp. FACHB-36]|uniref:serine/threonine-protein kinase n=1 Tax=Leptolyngbya sp. FACHB-36 TaxID=2692808 RepID=UPI00168098C0|nr:serine/threonine-protein kinase [Leptolyngbya sp. FACHB-36]MBD2020179.1 serine/threonine protein kinase [Leptolyngbya sp. FACHB-36]